MSDFSGEDHNCPYEYNPDQSDLDNDGIGDACDNDAPVYKWCWGGFLRYICLPVLVEVDIELWATLDNVPLELLADFSDVWPCLPYGCTYWAPIPSWANDLLMNIEFSDPYFWPPVHQKVVYYEHNGNEWEIFRIHELFDMKDISDFDYPVIVDTFGLSDSVFVLINLAEWSDTSEAHDSSYSFVGGICDQLPGCYIGSSPFEFNPDAPASERPYSTIPLSGDFIISGSINTVGSYLCGDTNGDRMVNISDAVHIINFIFIGGDEPEPKQSGDVNCDTSVNISDAVYIINYIFISGNNPCNPNGGPEPDC